MTARWLGVPPWVLLEQPMGWLAWGQAAMNAENGAEAEIQKRNARRARAQRAMGGQ